MEVRFLPIVERELRAAARQPRTAWRRVLAAGIALVVFVFVYLNLSRLTNASQVGSQIFSALSGCGVMFSILAGPLVTVDCIGRERREGTLGLLFLTDLCSHDVVLGKVAAASLDIMLCLVAALPVAAMPLLLGGISYLQFARLVLGLLNVMFMSLAAGICASSLFASGRASLGITLLLLGFLSLGLPMLWEEILKLPSDGAAGAWFYSICPLWTINCCLNVLPKRWAFWANVGGIHGLAWIFLAIACVRTRNAWRDLPVSLALVGICRDPGGLGSLPALFRFHGRHFRSTRLWGLDRCAFAAVRGLSGSHKLAPSSEFPFARRSARRAQLVETLVAIRAKTALWSLHSPEPVAELAATSAEIAAQRSRNQTSSSI